MYGWKGTILRIDLSTGKISKEPLDESLLDDYIGGRGLTTRLLYAEAGPDVDPKGPDNKLIFGTGPLTCTPFGAGRMTITTKSPQTGFINDGNMGGFFGPEMKFAGYDALIIQGKAAEPVYVFIDDGEVSIKKAKHLWGKTITDTHFAIVNELNDPKVKMVYIGPAGEHQAINSLIMGSLYNASGRGAAGAVMGSKNLKAIAVRGTGDVQVADPEGFMTAYAEWWKELDPTECIDVYYRAWGNIGDSFSFEYLKAIDGVCVKNDQTGVCEAGEELSTSFLRNLTVRPQSCFACPMPSCTPLISNKGHLIKVHAGTIMSVGTNLGVLDMHAIMDNQVYCNEMGLDNFAAFALSWAFEAYQRGIITKKDTDGLELKWGDNAVVRELLRKLCYREGFGNVLADGVKVASEKYGGKEFAMQSKGVEFTTVTTRAFLNMGLAYAVSDMGADHCRVYPPYAPTPSSVPPDITLPFDMAKAGRRDLPDEKGKLVKWSLDTRAIVNSLEICTYISRGRLYSDFRPLAKALNAATGRNYTQESFMKSGERIVNLERSFNVMNGGASRADDTLPERMLKEPYKEGGSAGVTVPLDIMLDEYYTVRGWNVKTGRPTLEKLEELDLGFIARDFQAKGVLSNEIA